VSGNVLLRREHYRRADDMDTSAKVAKAVITGKLANCRIVLRRALRDHPDTLAIRKIGIGSLPKRERGLEQEYCCASN
jgi:CRISPR-associated protein Cas1